VFVFLQKKRELFFSLPSLFPLSSLLSLSLIKVKIPSNERRRRSLEGKSRSSGTPIAVQSRLHFRERLGERARRWDKLVRCLLCLFVFFLLLLLLSCDDDVFLFPFVCFSSSSRARFMSIRRESTRWMRTKDEREKRERESALACVLRWLATGGGSGPSLHSLF
jgi:hypothetical protein